MKKRQILFLGTGELMFATEPCEVRTILGSCVGIALFDPIHRWGGLCHYLLAKDPMLDEPGANGSSTKFGQVAIPALATKLIRAGSHKRNLVAVVAGGALRLTSNEIFFVGEKNVQVAQNLLDTLGIRVVHWDVGGDRGRKMVFCTDDGSYSIDTIIEPDRDAPLF